MGSFNDVITVTVAAASVAAATALFTVVSADDATSFTVLAISCMSDTIDDVPVGVNKSVNDFVNDCCNSVKQSFNKASAFAGNDNIH